MTGRPYPTPRRLKSTAWFVALQGHGCDLRVAVALPPDYEAALATYGAKMHARFGPRLVRVCLFGSWARGHAREHSDVDVAVIVEGLTREERDAAIADTVDVELAHAVSLSPYVVSAERFEELRRRERRIAHDVLREGVPLLAEDGA